MIKQALITFFALYSGLPVFANEAVEIPFQFTDGFIRVEVQLASSPQPLSMLLDSGASVSVLDLKAAHRLQVRTGEPMTIRGVQSDADAYEIRPLSATIAGVNCGPIMLAADMSQTNTLCSEPIDGLIGIDFFRDRIVQIDYKRQCLRLLSRFERPHGTLRLPLKIINNVACVEVGVNGSNLRWTRLDTGCNDPLHWVIPKRERRGKPRTASIGFVTETRDIAPARVSLGSRVLHSVPTAMHGRQFFDGEAGLLGNGLLSKFTVTLDWPSQSLVLEDQSTEP